MTKKFIIVFIVLFLLPTAVHGKNHRLIHQETAVHGKNHRLIHQETAVHGENHRLVHQETSVHGKNHRLVHQETSVHGKSHLSIHQEMLVHEGAHRLIHPEIPQHTQKVETAIVMLSENVTKTDIQQLLKNYPKIKLRHVFEHVINGFSISGPVETLDKLASDYPVQHVSTVKKYSVTTEKSVQLIGGQQIRGMYDGNKRRLTGKGVTVGVIDTGIDYHHPDLANNYLGGKDLVDDDNDPLETKRDGTFQTIHGTHVAGVIAANGRIQGVAPETKIIAYRALGPDGSGTTEQIIAALEKAVIDQVDIINLSLGNTINGPDLPISIALNNVVDKGIVAVTSNGNSGPNFWTVGSPGTATKAISVGASTPLMNIPYLQAEGMESLRLQPLHGSLPWKFDRSYELIDGGLGTKADLKEANGKIVLIKRGELTFYEKIHNATLAGAVAVIIYNNTKGSFHGNIESDVNIPSATISKKLGEQLKRKLSEKKLPVTITLNTEVDQLADFSSRGPVTVTWEIKPDVVAPGVAINSTIPGGYLSMQGTSMAAPHVAGATALIKQAHPEWTPAQIKAALMHSAKQIHTVNGEPYRTIEQGAGRVDIIEAIQMESFVIPSALHFGKIKIANQAHRQQAFFTVENISDAQKKYYFTIPKITKGVRWKIPQSFTLKPKEKKRIAIEIIVDTNELTEKIYDGFLTLNEGANKLSIPYLYVIEEPNYPRVMGFEFVEGDGQFPYRYEVYLPGGADEFGIALFDPDDYTFVGFLDTGKELKQGLIEKNITTEQLPKKGTYIAKVFAKKAGKENMIETVIEIAKTDTKKQHIFQENGYKKYHFSIIQGD